MYCSFLIEIAENDATTIAHNISTWCFEVLANSSVGATLGWSWPAMRKGTGTACKTGRGLVRLRAVGMGVGDVVQQPRSALVHPKSSGGD